jgi:3-ketosteroid 9alpha-monooxygenase subunit B
MSSPESEAKHAFHPLRVARVIDETRDAKSIVFEIPAELAEMFKYRSGQFLTLELSLDSGTVRRCYSLASSPQADGGHKVTVKRIKDGRASNWINDNLREKDIVRVLAPDGRFVLTGTDRPLLLFAGGSGITPVISLLKTALVTTQRNVRLVYANRDLNSIIFRAELDALAKKWGERVSLEYRLDDRDGFVREGDVASFMRGFEDAEAYLCGPTEFMDEIERGLASAGVAPERVHVERFLSLPDPKPHEIAPPAAAVDDTTPATIAVTLAGVTHEVRYRAGQSLLRAALDAGLDAPYSCEEGFCGTCTSQLLEGQVKMDADDALTSAEKKRGLILACQSRPLTKKCAFKFLD